MPTSVWAPDTTIKTAEVNPETQHPTAWEADTGLYRARLGGYCDGAPRTEVTCGNASLVWETARLSWLIYDEGAAQPRWQLAAAVPTCDGQAETVTDGDHDRITIRGAYSGAGADEYEVYGNALKHSVILQSVAVPDGATELALDGYLTLTGCAPGYTSGRTAGDLYLFPLNADGTPNTSAAPVLTLLRGQVSDSDDHVTHTVYEWRTEEDGRISLALLVDAEWLAGAAPGEITIDPTVVASSVTSSSATAYPNQRKVARFSNGVLFAPFNDGTNLVCRYSADNGATWQTPASGATIGAYSAASVFIDEDDYIHVVAGYGSSISYVRGTPNSERTTYTWSSVTNLYGTNVSYNFVPDVVAHREGTGWVAHVVWAYANPSGADFSVPYERLTITSGGVVTKGGTSVLWSYLVGGDAAIEYPSVAIDSARNLYVTWNTGKTGTGYGIRFRKATYSSGSWTWGTDEAVVDTIYGAPMGPCSVDSQGRVVVSFRDQNSYARAYRRAAGGGWTQLTSSTWGCNQCAHTIDDDDCVYLFFTGTVITGLNVAKYDGAWGSVTTVDSDATASNPSPRRDTSGYAVDVLYTTGSGSPYTVKHHRISLNTAPQEPTITAPASFHTPTGLALTVTQNDTSGDSLTGVYLRAVGSDSTDRYWDGSAWQTTEPGTPIAASGASWTATISTGWVAGVTYQLYAATVDAGGLKGPYNSTAVVTKASTKPTYTGTSPGASITSGRIQLRGTMTCGSGATPASYVARIYAADGTTVLHGPVTVNSTGALAYDPPYDHTNGLTYYWGVTPTDSDGLAGDEATDDYAATFTVPATPSATVIPLADEFPPHVAITPSSPEPTGSQPTVTSYRIERSIDQTTVTDLGTIFPGDTHDDTCGMSGQVYSYRVVAIGDNQTTAASPWYTAGIDRDCHWFVPVDYPELAIPFAFNREASMQDTRAFAVVKGQGRYPVTTARTGAAYEANITATFPNYSDATPHAAVQLTKEQWRERFDTVATRYQGYWVTPDGMVKRGILSPISVNMVRDMVINPYVINCRFIEKKAVAP